MATPAKKQDVTIEVIEVSQGSLQFFIKGNSPMISNAMSNKALHELLLPKGRKSSADKAKNAKHDVISEWQHSMYKDMRAEAPTLLLQRSTAIKNGIVGAVRHSGGASMTALRQLIYVVGDYIPIYGTPKLMMAVTRSADMKRTPDVRTRAIVEDWCSTFTIEFIEPNLRAKNIVQLLSAAGMTQGLGDWRVEKGGNFGRFSVADEDDSTIQFLMENAGRKAQLEALKTPEPYDSETETLFQWYLDEVKERGLKVAA